MSETNVTSKRSFWGSAFAALLCLAAIPFICMLIVVAFVGLTVQSAEADDSSLDSPRRSAIQERDLAARRQIRSAQTRSILSPVHPPATLQTRWEPSIPPETETLRLQIQRTPPDDPARKELVAKLRTLLSKEFEEMHERQGKELDAAKKRLEKLQSTHQLREDRKEEIIERRLAQLTGQPDVLDWVPQSLSPQPTPRHPASRPFNPDAWQQNREFRPTHTFPNVSRERSTKQRDPLDSRDPRRDPSDRNSGYTTPPTVESAAQETSY